MPNNKSTVRRARQWWTTESREWEDGNEVANDRKLSELMNEDAGIHINEHYMLPTK